MEMKGKFRRASSRTDVSVFLYGDDENGPPHAYRQRREEKRKDDKNEADR